MIYALLHETCLIKKKNTSRLNTNTRRKIFRFLFLSQSPEKKKGSSLQLLSMCMENMFSSLRKSFEKSVEGIQRDRTKSQLVHSAIMESTCLMVIGY